MHVWPEVVHCVPAVHVPPHPSRGASPQARVEGGAHAGAQQAGPVQRAPLGHIVPLGHIGQPAGSLGSVPQASVLGAAHVGQHMPLVHVLPGLHICPAPHVRHTAPVASC